MVNILVREAIRDAIAEEMERDERVFILGEEVAEYQGAYKVTQGLLAKFGAKRVIDTPIVEHAFTGLAVGAAFNGLRPIVEFMTFNFAMQAIDHIVNSAAKTHYMSAGSITCPIVFRGPNGVARRTAAQHSQCFASWYGHLPGLIVVAPYSADDHKGLLKAAIRSDNPVVFLESELLYGESHEVDENALQIDNVMALGEAIVRIEGADVTLVSYSRQVSNILQAARDLMKDGISAEVIDLRTIRPLDIDTIVKSVRKTNRLLIVEDGWPFAGIASEIAMQVVELAFDYLDAPIARITGKEVPMPYAENLETAAVPQVADITVAAKLLCYRNKA